jgi:hypothetical protein
MEKPRDIFLDACAQIAARLEVHGFKYDKTRRRGQRPHDDFIFVIQFSSSYLNQAGSHVQLWFSPWAVSKHLVAWRASQPHPLFIGEGVVLGLPTPREWGNCNLADPASRPATIATAIALIERFALPYFALFEDVPSLCRRLVAENLPVTSPVGALELLLCFADRHSAEAYLHRFFRASPDILKPYFIELEQFRRSGLPPGRQNGYAAEFAYATLAYGLNPPQNS